MMSQPDLSLDSTYIVSSNGDYQGNKIVVNVLSESPAVTSMSPVHSQHSHVVPLHVVSNNTIPHQYLSNAGTLSNIQHLHTTDQQIGQNTVEDHGTVIEVTPVTLCDPEQKSNSSTEDDQGSRTPGVSWPKKAVLKLILLHKEHQHLFDDNHYKKKSIWEMIARKMKENNMAYSWSQVENKWKSLTKRYRDTVDYNARNNTVLQHSCPFFDEIAQAYPYVSPHVSGVGLSPFSQLPTTSTPTKRPIELPGGVSEADLASLTKKKKYVNAGASTANSTQTVVGTAGASTSTAPNTGAQSVDLGILLRSIHEDRKRQDKLKMDRLEKMHKEKMEMFKQFLDIVKDMKSKD